MRGPQALRGGAAAGASEDDEESNSDSVLNSHHSSGSLLTRLPTYPSSQNTSNSHPY